MEKDQRKVNFEPEYRHRQSDLFFKTCFFGIKTTIMTVMYQRSCLLLFCLTWGILGITNLSAYSQLSLDTSRVGKQIRTLQIEPATCFGLSDGVAEVRVKSTEEPVYIEWDANPRLNTQRVSGLSPGKHWVTLSDRRGNVYTDSVLIEARFSLEAEAMVLSDVTEAMARDGVAGVQVLNAQGSVSYLWEAFPSHNKAIISGLDVGMYTVTIKDQMGCETTEAVSIVQHSPTPDSEFDFSSLSSFHLFPNPSSGQLILTLPDEVFSLSTLIIYDLSGREVFYLEEEMYSGSSIDVGHLSKGMYSVILENGDTRFTTKLQLN